MAEPGKVIIVGGGIAGLSAAYRCIERGIKGVHLLEASDALGGLARSIQFGDYILDLGPHQIHTQSQRVITFLENLLRDDLLVKTKVASQKFLGKDIGYPMRLNDIFFKLPAHISISSLLSFLYQRFINIFKRTAPQTFEDWVIHHFGRRMYNIYFKPYTTKVWGKDPIHMTAQCAADRIAVQNLFDVILNAISDKFLRYSKHSNLTHSPYQRKFQYPKMGIGQISEEMAKFIETGGGKLHLHHKVKKITPSDRQIQVACENGSVFTSEHLISSIPVDLLNTTLPNHPSIQLCYRSLIFVFLILNKERITSNHWIYFPDKDCLFQRSSEFGNFSDAMTPPGHTSVCLEIPCDYEDQTWNMKDDDLVQRCLRDGEKQNFLHPSLFEDSLVRRERFAYPTFDMEHESKLRRILDFLEGFENIHTIGRQGRFQYINIDDVMLSGFDAAEGISI